MFGFPGKKEAGIAVRDKVFISGPSRLKALVELHRSEPETLSIGWFEDSVNALQLLLQENQVTGDVIHAREVQKQVLENRVPVFIEHYPLYAKEENLYRKLHLEEVVVYSSLEDSFFMRFGGEKIIDLLKKMGTGEEGLEHSLISGAIRNAQDKLASLVQLEYSGHSQKEWMEGNA